MNHSLTAKDFNIKITMREKHAWAELLDRRSGELWGPSPLIMPESLDIACRRLEFTPEYECEMRAIGETIEIRYRLPHREIDFLAKVAIEDGELLITVPFESIVERRSEIVKLGGVNILPDLMGSDASDASSHLVLPLSTGVLAYPSRHGDFKDSFLIYGEQPRWELLPLLPCVGTVRLVKNSALLAIAESGEHDAECRVDITKGVGKTSFSMRYVYQDGDPVDRIDRKLRIVPLNGSEASYAGMGRRMFKFAGKVSGRPVLKERAKDNPLLEYAATSYTFKMFHAHKDGGPVDGSGAYHMWMTFDEAGKELEYAKSCGMDRVWTQQVGWNPDGHDGKYPTHLPVDERLGGEAGFKRLLAKGRELGFQVSVHDNYTDLYKASEFFDPDHCVGAALGGPLKRGCWSGGINYLAWGLALPDEMLGGQMRKIKGLGIDATYYIDAMCNPLEISYNKKHGDFRCRRANAEGLSRVQREANKVFGSSGTEMGFLHIISQADYIASALYPGMCGTYPLADRIVPLWNMAVKGHIFCDSDHLKGFSIQGRRDSSLLDRMLNLAEIGLKPRDEISYNYSGWGVPVKFGIEARLLEYKLMIKDLRHILMEPIIDHQFLGGEPAEKTHATKSVFGDGTEILCDYKSKHLKVNGKDYPFPVNMEKEPAYRLGARN